MPPQQKKPGYLLSRQPGCLWKTRGFPSLSCNRFGFVVLFFLFYDMNSRESNTIELEEDKVQRRVPVFLCHFTGPLLCRVPVYSHPTEHIHATADHQCFPPGHTVEKALYLKGPGPGITEDNELLIFW